MPQHQRGQALIAITALLGTTLLVTIYALTQPVNQTAVDQQKTADALAQAKAALIGYAASNPNRPGELPCPDINNDGTADPLTGICEKLLGRLPWNTLGLPDIRDGSGERLWYALSSGFQPDSNSPAPAINSTTSGTITIYDSQGNKTSPVIAVLFAPGSPLQRENSGTEQSRDCGTDTTCNSTGICSSPLTPRCDPLNYLDILTNVPGVGNVDNSSFNGSTANNIIAGPITDPNDPQEILVNDQILAITTNDWLPVISKRVLREVGNLIVSSSHPPYPGAAEDSGTGNDCQGNPLKPPAAANNGDEAPVAPPIPLVPYNALHFDSTNASYNMLCNNGWLDLVNYQRDPIQIKLGTVVLQCGNGNCSFQ